MIKKKKISKKEHKVKEKKNLKEKNRFRQIREKFKKDNIK